MVIFHSYVKLPEGKCLVLDLRCGLQHRCIWRSCRSYRVSEEEGPWAWVQVAMDQYSSNSICRGWRYICIHLHTFIAYIYVHLFNTSTYISQLFSCSSRVIMLVLQCPCPRLQLVIIFFSRHSACWRTSTPSMQRAKPDYVKRLQRKFRWALDVADGHFDLVTCDMVKLKQPLSIHQASQRQHQLAKVQKSSCYSGGSPCIASSPQSSTCSGGLGHRTVEDQQMAASLVNSSYC